jgi:hypothetical protein
VEPGDDRRTNAARSACDKGHLTGCVSRPRHCHGSGSPPRLPLTRFDRAPNAIKHGKPLTG